MYDPFIMLELLSRPQVKEQIAHLTPYELEHFKEMLVHNGAYQRYATKRESEFFRQGWIRGDELEPY